MTNSLLPATEVFVSFFSGEMYPSAVFAAFTFCDCFGEISVERR